MTNGRSYISNAREEQQQYINGLLRENEKLRATAAIAEEQQRAAAGELDRLRARFDEIAVENQRFAEQYQSIEEQSNALANLYVASYQLHASVDRGTVLNAIQEIVVNLIGSEQLAIYEINDDAEFELAASFGLDSWPLLQIVGGENAVDRLGEGHIFDDPSQRQPLTACVRLQIENRVVGAILVFRLLEHKAALQPIDFELIEMLGVHASVALYCASLHAPPVMKG
jgi:nitrate/nitrite-specific signal transduction histidine kinase